MPLKLVRRPGSPNWYIRGTVRGVSIIETTGVPDKEQAETIRAKREWEILQASVHGRAATATFLEATVLYLEGGGEVRFIEPLAKHFGTTPLSRIGQAAIDNAAKVLYPSASPATWNRQVYTPVSAVLNFAAKRGLCNFRQLDRPEEPPGRVRWISPDEADRLIGCCALHLKPLVTFLFGTGARLSEALYLDWRNVDLARGHVQFINDTATQNRTKNRESRGVPLHARVVTALAELEHRDGTVFRRPDGLPYERKRKGDGGGQIKVAFGGACRRAGIADFHPHDCRHTWATWHYAANRDLTALMKLGGWKSERMVLRYAHVNVAHLAQSIAALPWTKSVQPAPYDQKQSTRRRT
jgi:integrase